MKLKYYISILFFVYGLKAEAQQELGTHFLTEVWQSTVTNPAFVSEQKWTIALPGLHYNFQHNGGGLDNVLRRNNGQSVIDFGNFIENLEEQNQLNAQVNIPTFEFAFKWNKWRLSLGHQSRFAAQLDYPKTLAQLLWEGNAPFVGQRVEFGPQLELFSYSELGLGIAYQLSNLTLGAKVKYLSGIGNITTEQSLASLYTSDDIYQLTFETDYEILTSSFLEINDLEDFNLNVNNGLGDLFTQNTGIAIDLGLRYQVNDKLELNVSLIDLGTINWQEGRTYKSQGSETYEGIDLAEFILNDSIEFDVKLDTLADAFAFEESTTTFSTNLTSKIYLGANYQLNEKLTFGGVYLLERSPINTSHAFSVSARANLLKMLTLGLTYSSRYKQFDNLGLNFVAKLGPVQLFGVTDNIIGLFGAGNSANISGRIGINIVL